MKKSSLTTAVVAGLAGAAGLVNVSNAVNINPDGMGQVLIYPYYTVNEGLSTLISVVNTTNDVKAVKVRFLEGRNSQEVLDFNLYLSPFDVWTGAVTDGQSDDADAGAVLTSSDTSCTVPAIPATGFPFVNFQYASNNDDGGPYGLDRTREGHLEIIEMGRVVDDGDVSAATGASVEGVDPVAGDTGATLATDATHITLTDGSRVPADCASINTAWTSGGVWADSDGNADIDEPNGGLFGGASIVDVVGGSNLSYNADAIDGFFTIADANLHSDPGTIEPTLARAETETGLATARIFDNGTLIELDFESGNPDAVSAVFMHDALFNEYVTSADIGASSEWVVTFPTKLLHLQLEEGVTPGGRLPFTATDRDDDLVPAFVAGVGACEPVDLFFRDREETAPGNQPEDLIPSPPPPVVEAPGLNLCYEAQVIAFNQDNVGEGFNPSEVLGSRYARNINLCRVFNADGSCQAGGAFSEGWARLELGDADNYLDSIDTDGDGFYSRAFGLPATGFWAAQYVNANVEAGILANYSGLHRHRGDRDGETIDAGTGLGTGTTWS
jgi:hypothetical protein